MIVKKPTEPAYSIQSQNINNALIQTQALINATLESQIKTRLDLIKKNKKAGKVAEFVQKLQNI